MLYHTNEIIELVCYECEGIEFQKFLGYFIDSKELVLKEKWECQNCKNINNYYMISKKKGK